MNQALQVRESNAVIAESVIAKGDLAKLTPAERTDYYKAVCESVGLNPLTQPLAYITLNGKLTLYALKGATDQLRKIYKISVTDMNDSIAEGVLTVTVKVADADGRTDIAKGAVNIAGLKGEALANQVMKCETKAKRRATLSICGLGMLDESEVETTNGIVEPRAVRKTSHQLKMEGGDDVMKSLTQKVGECTTVPQLQALHKEYAGTIATWPPDWLATFEGEIYTPKLEELREVAKHKPRTPKLTDEESAKVRAILTGLLHACTDASEIAEWRDTNVVAFRQMLKADQQDVVRERDARLAELFNATGDVEVDADGVVVE